MKTNTDVFISYSSKNYKAALFLYNTLTENDISCWMAPQSIPAGADYTASIPKGIKNSKVVLLVLSEKSQQSKWVMQEIETAFENKKTIIPYAIENCELKSEFDFLIESGNCIDGYHHRTGSLVQLIRAINNAIGRSETSRQKLLMQRRRRSLGISLVILATAILVLSTIFGFHVGKLTQREKKISGTDTVLDDAGASLGTTSWNYDRDTKTLTISGQGKMPDYSYKEDPPWMQMTEKEDHGTVSIVVEDGVTEIGSYAFRGIFAKSISLPESVTRLGETSLAFNNVSELTLPDHLRVIEESALSHLDVTEITIPDSVTDIGDECFEGCDELTQLTLPQSLENLGNNLFDDCDLLETVILPEDNANFVQIDNVIFTADMQKLSYYLSKNDSYTVPESVKVIGAYAFAFSDIVSLNLPKGLLTIEDYAFYFCTQLKELDLPKSITYIGESVFTDCKLIESIDIPPLLTVIKMGSFSHMGVREFVVPDGVQKIESNAFCGCDHLKSVTIPPSVTEIGDIFFMDRNPNVVIRCQKGSEAEAYANRGNSYGVTYNVEYMD